MVAQSSEGGTGCAVRLPVAVTTGGAHHPAGGAGRGEDCTASAADSGTPCLAATALHVRDGSSVARRRAQILAPSGFGNARSVALVRSALAYGGSVVGVRPLSQAGCNRAREEQFSGDGLRLHASSADGCRPNEAALSAP